MSNDLNWTNGSGTRRCKRRKSGSASGSSTMRHRKRSIVGWQTGRDKGKSSKRKSTAGKYFSIIKVCLPKTKTNKRQNKQTEKAAAAAAAAAQVVVQPTPSQVRKAQLDQKRRMEQQYQRLVAYLWKVEQEAVAEGVRHFVEKKKKKRRSASCHQLLREKQQQVEKQWIEKTRRRPTPTPPHTRPPSSTSSSVASRDPKRLFKPTSASIARQLPDPSAEDHQEFIRCPPTKPYILDISSR